MTGAAIDQVSRQDRTGRGGDAADLRAGGLRVAALAGPRAPAGQAAGARSRHFERCYLALEHAYVGGAVQAIFSARGSWAAWFR
ncbi:MAG: hypothetical protein ACLVB5_03785 [Christensenellales bacterium]